MADYPLLYSQGDICYWYLRDNQVTLYNLLRERKDVVTNCHRRFGKDSVVLAYCSEEAIKTKNLIIRYGAPTIKQAYEISDFLLTKIYSRDPESRPSYKDKGGYWEWSNGSKMYLFGGKDRVEVEKGRGVEADIIVLSEFGFFKYRPEYLLTDVLGPQLDTTGGQLIIVSTVPEDITHVYIEKLQQATKEKRIFECNILESYRNGARTLSQLKKIIKRCGGVKSDSFQREYLCRLIPSQGRLIIPEAQNEALWVGTQDRPEYYDGYEVADLGLRDHTSVDFGYLDFKSGRLIIEDELWFNYNSTKEIVNKWRAKSKEVNYNNPRRIADNEQQQLTDMSRDYDWQVSPVIKRKNTQTNQNYLDSIINGLRVGVSSGKLMIDKDKCPNLYAQLKYGIWNERRTDFERSKDMGHWDAGMSLCYMYDNINWGKNPYPVIPDRDAQGRPINEWTHFIEPELKIKARSNEVKLAKIFGRKVR